MSEDHPTPARPADERAGEPGHELPAAPQWWSQPPPHQGHQPPHEAFPGHQPQDAFQPHQASPWPAPSTPVFSPPAPAGPPTRSAVAGWLWPVMTVLALVVGLLGGMAGGALVADQRQSGGGLLHVQRRTALPLPADNRSIPAVAAKVLPSTVQIIAEFDGNAQGATGSGFVIDRQGHVITNNHVVAEAAADQGPIEVIDHRGRRLRASVVGRSSVYDIAVLEVQGARSLRPAAFGSADQMRVGETVVAIGSPLGLSATVTSGIVSAVHRPVTTGNGSDSSYINAVQTDAAINPGNSGGPLVNLQGQVVGVNSAIASLGSSVSNGESGNIGVGFAIPIEQVEVTTDQILKTGEAKYPVIGANVRGTRDLGGAKVDSVVPGQPAARAGLRAGDLITQLDGQPISGSIDLVVAIRTHVPGDRVTLTVQRQGQTKKISVRLAAKVG